MTAPGDDGPLGHAWRVLATGLAFSVFGLASVLFGFTVFPLACLPARDAATARRRAQWIVHRWFQFFAGLMRTLGLIRVEVHGAAALRRPGRLIVANHPTLIDVVLLIAHIPEVDCIVKPAVFANPFMRWPARWAGYISHESPEQLLRDCVAALAQGHSLVIFPEGTRTVPGQPIRMTHGAARIALEADAEVLPVSITCAPPTLSKHNPWYRVPPRRARFTLTVGEPCPARSIAPGVAPSVGARRLTHHWEQYFAACTGQQAAHPGGSALSSMAAL